MREGLDAKLRGPALVDSTAIFDILLLLRRVLAGLLISNSYSESDLSECTLFHSMLMLLSINRLPLLLHPPSFPSCKKLDPALHGCPLALNQRSDLKMATAQPHHRGQ